MMGFFVSAEERKPGRPPGSNVYRIPEERYVAARVLYESTPGMSMVQCADEVGVSHRSLEERSRKDGGWTKRSLMPPTGMTEAAQAVADQYTAKLADYGDQTTKEQRDAALRETATEVAVDLRAQVLDRHRKEWRIIDMLLGEHVKGRDFDRAKLTKITAEALAIKQAGERKAWGLDKPGENEGAQNVTVVIEREAS